MQGGISSEILTVKERIDIVTSIFDNVKRTNAHTCDAAVHLLHEMALETSISPVKRGFRVFFLYPTV